MPMRFHADLHVHSKYSRATSRDLDLEHLAALAQRKGIGLVGTGDFCHPAWQAELNEKLVPAEPGLFRLRDDIAASVAATLPPSCRADVRFMLEVEISTIYKKGDKTRKVHHLIYAPDFATMERISARLARIGNIASDGRPILGLDSRDLLEITLESDPGAYLVPAHIWTPWFAALGSMSGFDTIAECYGDLSQHIFAVETGLSSDPPMNWRVSFLDRYRLTSNSDAHSPGKLGREATTFDCDMDYFALRRALETGDGFVGTVEFFPEEGKYHLDGHRACNVRLTPKETIALGGRCPACGGKVTVGVEHRVELLADRDVVLAPPATAGTVTNLVALPEILSEIAGSGVGSKKVEQMYERVTTALGPELAVLAEVPVEDIARGGGSVLAEAITRLRAGKVIREAGYDGEYGVIRLFEDGELSGLRASMLFDAPVARKAAAKRAVIPAGREAREPGPITTSDAKLEPAATFGLDPDQQRAVEIIDGPLMILAGPGAGKTRTLTHRIAHLIERGVAPEHCLAVTFTRRAAAEMRERLNDMLGARASAIAIHTFHSLGLSILREHTEAAGLRDGFKIADEAERVAMLMEAMDLTERKAETMLRAVSKAKRLAGPMSVEAAEQVATYARMMGERNWIDFDDLVGLSTRLLAGNLEILAKIRTRTKHVSIDEFQDIDEQQYRLVTLLAPGPDANLCIIGDPDQAIYGFRGADSSCFARFRRDYAAAEIVLARNYRSSGTIVAASSQMIGAGENRAAAEIIRAMSERISIHIAPTESSEAEFVVQTIEGLIGGHSFFSIDSGRGGRSAANLSFSDFAVLYRTDAQSEPLVEAFARSGIPFRKSGSETPGTMDDESGEYVSLLTLHAAKGLEFRVVFIAGLEDGILPLTFGTPDEASLAEERRLFYVGMTRACDQLVLLRANQRRWRGRVQTLAPSPFLADIEQELLKHQRNDALRRKPENRQLSLF